MMRSSEVRQRILFADGFRAFAIFLVVASHLPVTIPHLDTDALGSWGVNCFFVLSGLLLARPYLRALLDPSRPWPSTRLFLLRRVLRIYPLYAVSVVVSCGLVVAAGKPFPSPDQIVSHLLMLQGLSPLTVTGIDNAPLWTMPVDAAFYLALPLFAGGLALAVSHLSRRFRVGLIAGALGAIVVSGVLSRYVACRVDPMVLRDVAVRAVLIHNVVGMAPAFCIGIALALLSLLRPRRMPRRGRLVAAAVAAAAFAALVPHMNFHTGSAAGTLTLRIVFVDLIAAISVGLAVFTVERIPELVTAVLRSRLVAALAALSYAVYLFHFPVLLAVQHRFGTRVGAVVAIEETVLTLAITFAVAYVGHRFIEQPFLDIKDRKREALVRSDADVEAMIPGAALPSAP